MIVNHHPAILDLRRTKKTRLYYVGDGERVLEVIAGPNVLEQGSFFVDVKDEDGFERFEYHGLEHTLTYKRETEEPVFPEATTDEIDALAELDSEPLANTLDKLAAILNN